MALLTTEETATRIGVSVSWLNHARQSGTGPVYVKIGHKVRYRPEDVEAFLDSKSRLKIWQFEQTA